MQNILPHDVKVVCLKFRIAKKHDLESCKLRMVILLPAQHYLWYRKSLVQNEHSNFNDASAAAKITCANEPSPRSITTSNCFRTGWSLQTIHAGIVKS